MADDVSMVSARDHDRILVQATLRELEAVGPWELDDAPGWKIERWEMGD